MRGVAYGNKNGEYIQLQSRMAATVYCCYVRDELLVKIVTFIAPTALL